MTTFLRWCGVLVAGLIAAVAVGLLIIALATPRLPPITAVADYNPKMPLRIMTADGVLIGEFGEERRSLVRLPDVPKHLVQAILAAEDDGFFQHRGIDFAGIARAMAANLFTGSKSQGASTITMQVARNFFLSSEKTFTRKIYEVLLASEIERKLSKNQILELYLNQIYLGKRAYGFAAASQTYFGKEITQLSLAEAAMLAGLPKAPSAFNPATNLHRATLRQHYVLGRMQKLGLISARDAEAAKRERITVIGKADEFPVRASYVAEMARQLVFDQFRDQAYTRGLTVYTTITADEQRAANRAVRAGLLEFDRRQGWRGPEAFITLPGAREAFEDAIDDALSDRPDSEDLLTAIVTEVAEDKVVVRRSRGQRIEIIGDGLKFASPGLSAVAPAAKRLRKGAIVRIARMTNGEFEIVQMPEVESGFVALQPQTGAVRALVGGFDFNRNKFNRVTQAWRQPGSAFKPFVYSAALTRGFSPATIVNDAPIQFDAGQTGGQAWEPKNYDGKFDGPMPLRTGLAKSKNMVSIRVLQSIGARYAQDYVTRFGFEPEKNPAYLTMALGAGSVTLMQMAGGYSVFANGGYRINPYIIDRIVDLKGKVVAKAQPLKAGTETHRVMDPRHVFIMDSLLQEVVKSGTATRALQLGRTDLAGKTGTTNDSMDAWFAGYTPTIVGVAWVGYDTPKKLGDRETGGGLALPIWMDYMKVALAKGTASPRAMPQGVLTINGEYYTQESRPGVGVASVGLR
ncbi:MAG: penicillin-binding protein 1A [Burkholderiaceae bacterium]